MHMQHSCGRLISKTHLIKLIKDAYGTLVWKTCFKESFQRVVLKSHFETHLIKLIKDAMQHSC